MPGGGLKEIIPLLLQIDEGKRQERQVAAQEMQAQTQQKLEQGSAFTEFRNSLDAVKDPNALNAMMDFYSSNFGIDRKALENFSAQYLPTLAAQRAGASYTGQAQMTPEDRLTYNRTAAYSNITGMGQADAAQQQAESRLFSNPAIFNSAVQFGAMFRRTGYQPGKQEIALNIAGDPAKVEKAAASEAGTDYSAATAQQFVQNLLQMKNQRDISTQGNAVQIRGQNLQNLESSRSYALGLLPFEMAKMGAGGAGELGKPQDVMKMLLDALQEQSKGGSPLHQSILDNIINKNAANLNLFQRDKNGNPITPSGTYAPSLFDRFTR